MTGRRGITARDLGPFSHDVLWIDVDGLDDTPS